MQLSKLKRLQEPRLVLATTSSRKKGALWETSRIVPGSNPNSLQNIFQY